MTQINPQEILTIVNLYRKILQREMIDGYHAELIEKIIKISQYNSNISDLLDEIDLEFASAIGESESITSLDSYDSMIPKQKSESQVNQPNDSEINNKNRRIELKKCQNFNEKLNSKPVKYPIRKRSARKRPERKSRKVSSQLVLQVVSLKTQSLSRESNLTVDYQDNDKSNYRLRRHNRQNYRSRQSNHRGNY